jgi:hypothetical protein
MGSRRECGKGGRARRLRLWSAVATGARSAVAAGVSRGSEVAKRSVWAIMGPLFRVRGDSTTGFGELNDLTEAESRSR